jgi:hypothetical protein
MCPRGQRPQRFGSVSFVLESKGRRAAISNHSRKRREILRHRLLVCEQFVGDESAGYQQQRDRAARHNDQRQLSLD